MSDHHDHEPLASGDPEDHAATHAHDHPHEHDHPTGFRGVIEGIFRPHSHDAADSIDTALESSERGIRAVRISFLVLFLTSIAQLVLVVVTGSVALLADTIHNFSDALTAIPLFLAFKLSRRPSNPRYTYGYGRAEDLAGIFVILMIAISAVIAGWEAINRLIHPEPLSNLGVLFAAGLVGFAGNELVALYRIREGNAIGSAALVADGYHARTDGFTSLAVAFGAIGVWLGFERADPIVGLMISVAIFVVLKSAAKQVYEAAGVGPDDVDVCELHDCFAQNELITYEGLGFCPVGEAERFVESGGNTYGGKVVTNPSGGLLSKGHPLGATGLAQCYELTRQLRGTAEATQVKAAKIALQHNLGLGGAAVVTIYGHV